jgi:transcriptional regulator with XRE-family HTH domain
MSKTAYKEFVCGNLALAREAIGMPLGEFARRIGVSPQQLANYENGDAYPDRIAVVRACEEFGFSCDWFYRGLRSGLADHLAGKLLQAERERDCGGVN